MATVDIFRRSPLALTLESLNLQIVDVGSRGGIDTDFLPAAWATTAIGFEPEPDEYSKLSAVKPAPWRALRIVPAAVSGVNGMRTLHLSSNEAGASLFPHNADMLTQFGYQDLHREARQLRVETVTLDSACQRFGLSAPDYLKLDVEGAELEILRGSPAALAQCSAVKIEVSFLEQRISQPLIQEVVAFMLDSGFAVGDIRDVAYWRRRPMAAHPLSARSTVPYSRGVAAQCDLMFLRRHENSDNVEQLIRQVVVTSVLGFFDAAITTLRELPSVDAALRSRIGGDCVEALGGISLRMGRAAAVRELSARLRGLVPLVRSLVRGIRPDTAIEGY